MSLTLMPQLCRSSIDRYVNAPNSEEEEAEEDATARDAVATDMVEGGGNGKIVASSECLVSCLAAVTLAEPSLFLFHFSAFPMVSVFHFFFPKFFRA